MKLGIGLPNTMAHETDRQLMLEWARLSDEAGFHVLSTIDKPNYDSWDPLATLAGVAGMSERARLNTGILQLPNRNEVLVAKQAAVVDQLSGGRLDLGVAVGGRADDYEVFGADPEGRGRRMEQQVNRIREIWRDARKSDRDQGLLGPPPVQDLPPIWIGASTPPAMDRAVRLGDGFMFGTVGPGRMAQATPEIRENARVEGKEDFTIAGLAYVGLGDDPARALDEAAHHVLRYYGKLWAEPEKVIHHGPPEAIGEAVHGYQEAGLDILILWPQIPDLAQVEMLAEGVLPAYLQG